MRFSMNVVQAARDLYHDLADEFLVLIRVLMAENRIPFAELGFQLDFEEVEKFVFLLPKGQRGTERKSVIAQVLVRTL